MSYHVRQLTEAGVITRERRGRYSYYGALDHIAALVADSGSASGSVQRRDRRGGLIHEHSYAA